MRTLDELSNFERGQLRNRLLLRAKRKLGNGKVGEALTYEGIGREFELSAQDVQRADEERREMGS